MSDIFPRPGFLSLDFYSGATFGLVVELFADEAQTVPLIVAGRSWRSEVRRTEEVTSDLLATIDVSPSSLVDWPAGNALDLYVAPDVVQRAVVLSAATRRGAWSLKEVIGDDARPWLAGPVLMHPDPTDVGGAA